MSGVPLIPASPFFLDHLLGLLFLVHVVLVNFVLAAPFVAAAYLFGQGERGLPTARWIAAAHPVAYTFAINSGVAVLLFVQVLFGKQFYTANTILGAKWLALIAIIIISFYGSYLFRNYLRRERPHPRAAGILGVLTGLLIVTVGVTMTTNYFIGFNEDRWADFMKSLGAVHRLPTFAPRFLHYLVGSVAVTGFWLAWIARFQGRAGADAEHALRLRVDGLRIAAIATGAQIIVGLWYLLRQPPEVLTLLFSGSFVSVVWVAGVGFGLVMLATLVLGILHPRKEIWLRLSSLLMLLTLVGMIAGRDVLRLSALGPRFSIRELPHATQSGPMTVFFVLLLIGIGIVVYLVRLLWPRAGSSDRDPAQ